MNMDQTKCDHCGKVHDTPNRHMSMLCRWVMIRVVNIIDLWLYTIASTNGRGRLEIWAYRRGWVEMWPGRKEDIEYSIEHRQEIEDWRNGGWRTARIERLEKRVEELENSNRPNDPSSTAADKT